MKHEQQHACCGSGWILVMLCIFWLTLAGCGDRGAQVEAASLVRVNDRSITLGEFNRRFDAWSAEFPESEKADAAVEKEMKLLRNHPSASLVETQVYTKLKRPYKHPMHMNDVNMQINVRKHEHRAKAEGALVRKYLHPTAPITWL